MCSFFLSLRSKPLETFLLVERLRGLETDGLGGLMGLAGLNPPQLSVASLQTAGDFSFSGELNNQPKGTSRQSQHSTHAMRGGSRSHTRQNSFISAGVPRETRTKVSMGGKRRPTRTLFCLKCAITSRTGRPESIMAKFVKDGIVFS